MNDKELNMVDHLDELRKRLIISAIAFIAFFIAAFLFVEKIYQWLVRDLDMKLIILGPTDILWVYFIIAGVMAISASIPVIAFQVWQFVKPGLLPHERKTTLRYIPALFLLFILGICFGYFIIFPTVLNFLIGLGGDMFMTSFTAEKYFRFLMNMTLPFAFLFELPAITMFLTSIGILNPYALAKVRKYAYFILIVIAVLLSPPDFISDVLVAIPLLLLYEISITLSKFVYKRRQKRLEDSREGEYETEEWA
ncbi:twin-arginine translocase subunit TatC [Bacillus sp. AGMB 02131]|uniref:Sec-independent protein translocase protein TatC n=1 Tax=Peribacillus faecalis TaxID=2772559 RepID=A0A927D1I6_9BACI|nr:twin-arginine translocase subunit TatC [Peribacillus faecalis]MBD3109855.1 twin-arginine translocase subunit TatC [Peribacillus faecalis]